MRLDHTVVDPWVALRNAVGFTAPMVIGELAGSISTALPACVGALLTSFADQPGPHRLRTFRWLAIAIGAGLYTGLSVAASRSTAASVVLLTVASFAVGLLVAAGDNAYTLGTLAILCGVVLGHIAQPPSVAVSVGLLVTAGAIGQGLLAIIAWPVARHRPERLVVRALYEQLAAAARQPGNSEATLPATAAVEAARHALYGPGNAGPSVDHYRNLLSEAERIRSEIVTLDALADRLAADGAAEGAEAVRATLAEAGDVLAAVAAAIGRGTTISATAVSVVDESIERTQYFLRHSLLSGEPADAGQAVEARLETLTGELRAVARATSRSDGPDRPSGQARSWQPTQSWHPADLAAGLRSAARAIDAPVLQHALRLAFLMGATDLVGRLLSYQRTYWVPLTIVIVLRPDFAATFQRTAMRVAGQLLGLVLAGALIRWVLHGTWGEIAAAGAFMFAARLCGSGNLGLAAINIAGFVVLLLDLAGYPAHPLIVDRAVATVIGGAVVILGLLLWPAWERRFVPTRLAELLDSYRVYLVAIADPRSSPADRQRARVASRVARSTAEASVERAAAEPVSAAAVIGLGRNVLATSHRIIRALVTLDALREAREVDAEPPEFTGLLDAAATDLGHCSLAVTGDRTPSGLIPLRPRQVRLHRALSQILDAGPGELVLIDATDRLSESIDVLTADLRQRDRASALVTAGHPDGLCPRAAP
ncbi:MAG TPA: FUSC family protein [Trebonia sp.]